MTPLHESLSPREEQVLLLFGDGLGEREIACRLGISHWTVRSHRSSAIHKLGATTTAHAVAVVVRLRVGAVG